MAFRSDVKLTYAFTWGELAGGELKKIARWAAQHHSKDIRFTLVVPEAILTEEEILMEESVEITHEHRGKLVGPRIPVKSSSPQNVPEPNSVAAVLKEALDKLPSDVRKRAMSLTLAELIADDGAPGGVEAKPTSIEDPEPREGLQDLTGSEETLEVTGASAKGAPMFRRAKNSVLLRVAGAENLLDCPCCGDRGTIRIVEGDLQCRSCGYSWGDVDELPEWI